MSDKVPPTDGASTTSEEDVAQIRKLLHDMNNGLEIIVQSTYLIGTLEMPETGRQWMQLLEQGVDQVAAINLRLRDAVQKLVG